MTDAVSGAQQQSSLTYGWLTVGLLTIAYIFSFIDRYVLGLLIEPIKVDLGLTDTQIGLLLDRLSRSFTPRWVCPWGGSQIAKIG